MTEKFDRELASREGHAQFKQGLAALIRAKAFAEVERFLSGQARILESEIGDICLSLPGDSVEIVGWEKL